MSAVIVDYRLTRRFSLRAINSTARWQVTMFPFLAISGDQFMLFINEWISGGARGGVSLSLSLAGKTRIICVGTCGFPRRYALAKEKGLLWRVGNYIGKWGRETEIRPQNFYFCIISIFNLYWEKIQFLDELECWDNMLFIRYKLFCACA